MKCVNIRTTAETILFDCPHCGLEAVIEDSSMLEYWTDYEGKVTCPVPQGCNMEYEIPTAEEVTASRSVDPAIEPTTATGSTEADGTTPATEATGESDAAEVADEPEAETEPEKPKFAGPFRYVSKDDEEEGPADKIEQLLGQKDEDEDEVASPLMIRTFRQLDCVVRGKNRFDDMVSTFLGEVGRENVISVTPINYTNKAENVNDYGVIIYYAQSQSTPAQPTAAEPKPEPVAWRD
jgi:hypothetical protein